MKNLRFPSSVVVTSGIGQGRSSQNALDGAMLDAGISGMNLIKTSGVLPPGIKVIDLKENGVDLKIEQGAMVASIFSYVTSNTALQKIAAAISIGIPENPRASLLVFETGISGSASEAKNNSETMILDAFQLRQQELKNVVSFAAECSVGTGFSPKYSCALVVALLL